MSLFGCFRFWAPTRFLEVICPTHNPVKDSILVTEDVVEIYPSIPHEIGLKALEKTLIIRANKNVSTENLLIWLTSSSKTLTLSLMVKLSSEF